MLSLYLHIPFCAKKCLYCGFYSTQYDKLAAELFTSALRKEIEGIAGKFVNRNFDTLYIGGGTPTVLTPEQLKTVTSIVKEYFSFTPDAEFTVEANPQSGSENIFATLLECGVNRLSIGVQSFDDSVLRSLGRPHTAAQARDAVVLARGAGFSNISIDLIYGIPGQRTLDWHETLARAIALEPDHLSAYSLSLDEGSSYFRKNKQGTFQLPDEDAVAELYDMGVQQLTAAGYGHYEISNFARQGFECLHNMNYWGRGEYLGLGPGAWSFIGSRRSRCVADVAVYCERLRSGLSIAGHEEQVGPDEAALETVMLRLRTRNGLELASFERTFGAVMVGRLMERSTPMIEMGLLRLVSGHLSLTGRGMVLSNDVITRLTA